MQIREMMTPNPVCCTPDTELQQAAQMMAEHDCGALPVVENERSRTPIGMITDRDIVCRVLADGRDPLRAHVSDAMTANPVAVSIDSDLEECERLMEQNQVRRLPVVDQTGGICGIVAQADIALRASLDDVGEVVRDISQPQSLH